MSKAAILALAASLLASPSFAGAQPVAANAPRVINVTTDSAAGWLPSAELDAEAIAFLHSYFSAYDHGDDAKLWQSTTDGLKSLSSFAQFQTDNRRTRQDLGRLEKLEVLKVTWTKDPANAPSPGIYVAIDISGRFARTQRHCGYVVLFKANDLDPFRLARIETNYMSDATAQAVAKAKSSDEVERAWSAVSANCPNYPNPSNTAH